MSKSVIDIRPFITMYKMCLIWKWMGGKYFDTITWFSDLLQAFLEMHSQNSVQVSGNVPVGDCLWLMSYQLTYKVVLRFNNL